jgi:hypothetical protein
MERPKLFEDGIIPDSIKAQNDGVQESRKNERLPKEEAKLKVMQEGYDAMAGDPEFGDKVHARDALLEQKSKVLMLEETIRRYDEDPNKDFLIGKIEQEEIKRKIMKEMGYSERMLALADQYIESLKKRYQE